MSFNRDESSSSSTSSSSSPSSPTNIDAPQVGWYGLIMNRRQELIASCEQIIIQLQRVSEQWKDQVPAITAFMGSMNQKLELLQQRHPDSSSKSQWTQFFDELKMGMDDLKNFTQILSDKRNSTPQIIAAFIEITKNWPKLIKAFNNLELDLIANGLFSSFSTTATNKAPTPSSIKNILPPYQFNQLENSIHWFEESLGKSFATYPQTLQNVILIAAGELNTVFRHAFLALDKFAVQIDFDLQKLVEEPIFTTARSSSPNVSFEELAIRFRNLYQNCMIKAGYTIHEEYYPFATALSRQRHRYPIALLEQEIHEAEKHTENWAKVKSNCSDIIEAQIRELEEEENSKSRMGKLLSRDKTPSINDLEALWKNLPETDSTLEQAITTHINKSTYKTVENTLNKVRATYSAAADRQRNRLAWFNKQNIHLQQLLAKTEISSSSYVPMQHYPVMTDIIREDAPKLIDHTQQLLLLFTHGNGPKSKETVFDNILNAVEKCEIKLKEMIDDGIYADWFERDELARIDIAFSHNIEEEEEKYEDDVQPAEPLLVQTSIEVNNAWMFHFAQLLKKIKSLAQEANQLQTKSTTEQRARTTPGLHFQSTIQQLDNTVVSLTNLMRTLNEFRHHPLISELPAVGDMLAQAIPTLQNTFQHTLVTPLSNHPLQQAWNERNDFGTATDKLQGGLQNIKRIYSGLLAQSSKDPAMIHIANHGLEQADDLLYKFQTTKSAVAFLIKRPRQIYKFVKSLADLFPTLFTLSGDQLLFAAKQLNDALRQLFLLFDKLELQFYLKENYFAKMISVNGQSLLELAKTFSDTLKEQGYIFKQEEAYPYKHAILAQRTELSALHAASDARTEKFINERISTAAKEITTDNNQTAQELVSQTALLKQNILNELNKRRTELLNEYRSAYYPSSTKMQKANLLHRLINHLQSSSSVGIQLGMFTSQERALLMDGRTGKLLQTLLVYGKNHFLVHIQHQIAEFKKPCTGSLFSSRQVQCDKIQALEALKSWLVLPGFRVDDAMKELKEQNLSLYRILEKHKLAEPLREIEKHIPSYLIGKKSHWRDGICCH